MNFSLLKELCMARAIPGQEDAVRVIVRRELEQLRPESLTTDPMGNLYARFAGQSEQIIMLAAHMDEIGFIIRHVDDKGFLRLQPLGGFDPRQLFAQRVLVSNKAGEAVPGVLCYATKPTHLMTKPDDKPPEVDQFFVDLGMEASKVQEQFEVGGMVTMDRDPIICGETVVGKSLDNRVGVFAMLECLRKLSRGPATVVAVATTQEEIGLRGAATAAFRVQPAIGIGLDTTIAADYPGGTPEAHVTRLGNGVGIKIMDSSMVSHPRLVRRMRDLAQEKCIAHQLEVLPRGGTDGGVLQRAASGCASITLSIPTRYIHTVNEMVSCRDIESCIDLLVAFLESTHPEEFDAG